MRACRAGYPWRSMSIAALCAATVACSAGSTVTLAGGGASYLVVPQYATGSAVNRPTSYTLGVVTGGASSNVVPLAGAALDLVGGQTLSIPQAIARHTRQRALDALLTSIARRNVESGAWQPRTRNLAP